MKPNQLLGVLILFVNIHRDNSHFILNDTHDLIARQLFLDQSDLTIIFTQATKVLKGRLVLTVHQGLLVQVEMQDLQEIRDLVDHKVMLDLLVRLDQVDHLDLQEILVSLVTLVLVD